MAIFRQYILPFIIVLVFLVSLVAVTARAFLPGDMAAPAPIEEPSQTKAAIPTVPTAIPTPVEAPLVTSPVVETPQQPQGQS